MVFVEKSQCVSYSFISTVVNTQFYQAIQQFHISHGKPNCYSFPLIFLRQVSTHHLKQNLYVHRQKWSEPKPKNSTTKPEVSTLSIFSFNLLAFNLRSISHKKRMNSEYGFGIRLISIVNLLQLTFLSLAKEINTCQTNSYHLSAKKEEQQCKFPFQNVKKDTRIRLNALHVAIFCKNSVMHPTNTRLAVVTNQNPPDIIQCGIIYERESQKQSSRNSNCWNKNRSMSVL